MAKRAKRMLITLACNECRERNYHTEKNRRNDPDRLELRKFCPRCREQRTSPRNAVTQRSDGCSSTGRAAVSKTAGCGFESCRPCHCSTARSSAWCCHQGADGQGRRPDRRLGNHGQTITEVRSGDDGRAYRPRNLPRER